MTGLRVFLYASRDENAMPARAIEEYRRNLRNPHSAFLIAARAFSCAL